MPTTEPRIPWRWARCLLVITALACGAAGQYWLTIRHVPLWSAAAWAAAVASFIALYALGRDARELPTTGEGGLPRNVEWLLCAAVMSIGVFFVLFRISEFPPGLNHDAAWEGLYALRVLQGGAPYTPYTPEAWGRETLTFYLRALSILIMGPQPLAVTAPSMVAGILILPFMYWWARNMFGARFALLVTVVLAGSGWHLVFSRTGWRSDFQPLFMAITCCFFIRAMITAEPLDFALSGIGLALTLNVYNGARVFPLLFPIWLVGVVMQSWHWRGFLRRYGAGLAFMAVAFLIAVAPLGWYAVHNWEIFQGRATALRGVTTLSEALRSTALLFNYRGNGDDFFTDTPALEFPAAIFFVFGLLWGVARLRDERAQFLALGLIINLLPGVVSKPNLNRDVGTMVFVYFFVALGIAFFATQLARLMPRRRTIVATVFVVAASAAALQATYAQYLSPHRRNVWGYYPETSVLGKYLKTLVPQYVIWVGGANYPRDALTYLTYMGGDPFQRNYTWLDDIGGLLRTPLAAPAGKGLAFALANEERGPAVLDELARRFPKHEIVEVRYPPESGRVFAKVLLVPSDGAPVAAPGAPPPSQPEVAAAEAGAPAGQLSQPRGVAVHSDGDILVCDFGHHRISEFSRDLHFVRQWGSQGELSGQFKEPCGVAVGPTGEIFVADTWNHRVQVFSKSGQFLREFGAAFYGPRGIAVDAKGSVFVADTGNNRIVRLSAEGKKEAEWGSRGAEPGKFVEPVGIAVSAAGEVYVADNGNGRLQIFTRDGHFVKQFSVPGWEGKVYSEPHVTLDPAGTIWVTVPGAKEVRAYDRTGKLLKTIASAAGSPFETPMGISYSVATKDLIVSDLEGKLVHLPAS